MVTVNTQNMHSFSVAETKSIIRNAVGGYEKPKLLVRFNTHAKIFQMFHLCSKAKLIPSAKR